MAWISGLYTVVLLGVAVFGLNMLLLAALAMVSRLRGRSGPGAGTVPPDPLDWPSVLVQLPLYNERYMAERVIDAVAALDYPAGRLTLQVLDDSTDDTTKIARARVAYHQARGRQITLIHRQQRTDFKAGALAAGLAVDSSEFVAIFDADFMPEPDFLRRIVPLFAADSRLAMVQARWEHLNAEQNQLTRAEAMAFDGYFGVEQVGRTQAGLLINFNGSAGVWRRAAIDDAGGWQGDTLVEDLDLAYRAQLRGWRMAYLPHVSAPAELPATAMAFKRQQFRWAKGSFQVLRKLAPRLLRARMPLFRKLQGFLHLSNYLPHTLILIQLLLSLPLVLLLHGQTLVPWEVFGLAGLGPPVVAVLGQLFLRPDWPKRLLYFPALILLGIGLAVNNTHAAWEAFFGQNHTFLRTPKLPPSGRGTSSYRVALDWTTSAEAFLAVYALVTGLLAIELAPGMAPFLFVHALSFGWIATLSFWQSGAVVRRRRALMSDVG